MQDQRRATQNKYIITQNGAHNKKPKRILEIPKKDVSCAAKTTQRAK